MTYNAAPKTERRALRALSRRAGCALLAVCALQLAASFAAVRLQNRLELGEGQWFTLLGVLSSLTILSGALLGRELLGDSASLGAVFSPPAGKKISFLLIPAGVALCMAGNIVGAFVDTLAEQAGVVFRGGPEQVAPQGLPSLLLTLLTVALLPAVTEEWLLRGVLLPPLRRFGDAFAVVCTALLFALLHQNMQQAPMAFVSGLALGWVYIRSGERLVIPMAVHLWNNAAAVALSLLSDAAANAYALALGALGLLSILILLFTGHPRSGGPACALPPWRRAGNFFFGSIAMILPLIYFVVVIVLNTGVE